MQLGEGRGGRPGNEVEASKDSLVLANSNCLLLEDVSGYSSVHSTERVVQEVDVSVPVDGPGQADAGALPPTQPDPSLPYQSQVTTGKASHVLMRQERVQRVSLQCLRDVALANTKGISSHRRGQEGM